MHCEKLGNGRSALVKKVRILVLGRIKVMTIHAQVRLIVNALEQAWNRGRCA